MNRNWKQLLHNFTADESGQDLVEYAMVTAFLALGAIAILTPLTTAITGVITKITTALNNV